VAAKTYSDWPDKAKHTIPYAQHKKNVAAKTGGGTSKPASTAQLPSAARVTARARKDPAFLQRALRNPGLRSRILDTALLPRDLQQQRELNAPIVPGSSMTGRDLARRAAAETTTAYAIPEAEYGQQLKAAQQHQADVGGWWDQYQAAINAGAEQVKAAQDQMVGGAQGVAQGVQGLGQAQIGGILGQAQATAAPGAPPTASLATEANRAQVARETLAGSYLGQAQQQAGASKGLAAYQAGVVAPGYKLQGLTQAQRDLDAVRDKQTALAVKKGADLLKTRADIRQQEIANTIAMQGLGIKAEAARTSAAAASPEAAAAKTGATAAATQAAKYGYTPHQWALLGPDGRQKAIRSFAAKKGGDKGPGDHYGYTDAQWAKMSAAEKRSAYADWNAAGRKGGKDGKDGKPGKGPDWVTSGQAGTAMTQLTSLRDLADKAKRGIKFVVPKGQQPTANPKAALDRRAAAAKIKANLPPGLKHPILITAALDAIYNEDGHLSANTVRGLIAAGYKPSEVARTLGVKTRGQWTPPGNPNIPASKI